MFEIAEMLGVQNPFEMEMSHRVFLWWRAYKELKFLKFHDKEEYYFAKLIQTVRNVFGDDCGLDEVLIEFKERDPEQEAIDAEEEGEKLFRG